MAAHLGDGTRISTSNRVLVLYCIMSTLATIPIITDPAALSTCLPQAHDLATSLVIPTEDDALTNDWSVHITQLQLLSTLWSIEDETTRHEKLVELHEQIQAASERGRGLALALRSSIDSSLPFVPSSMSVFRKPATVEQSAFQLRMLGGLVLSRTAELVDHVIVHANDTERPPWIELRGQCSSAASASGIKTRR
jgi:hypothetical protein